MDEDDQLARLLSQRIDHEREVSDLREQHHTDALQLQAAEYERRLQDLNHEAERLRQAVSVNVSADTWRAFMTAYDKAQEGIAARFQGIERFQNKLLGALAFVAVLAPVLTAILVYELTRHAP